MAFLVQGYEGWLYRESESTGEFVKVYATLYEHRLDYYKDRPAKGNDTVMGYLTVKGQAECDPFDKEGNGFFSSSGQYCFKLSDGTVEVSFSAASDDERIDWVEYIRAAIDGVRHIRPEGSTLSDQSTTEKAMMSKRVSAAREGMQAIIELPRKMGELSKKPIKGKFGMKTPKRRYQVVPYNIIIKIVLCVLQY